MSKNNQKVDYQLVKYVGLDGCVNEVIPSGKYKVVKGHLFGEMSCGETFGKNDDRLFDHALRLIATRPPFLADATLEWNLAYVAHIKDLFKDVLYNDFGAGLIPEIALAAVKAKRNLVYTTRLCSAASLLDMIINGGHIEGFDNVYRTAGIVSETGRWGEDTLAGKIANIGHYFSSGGFRSAMTRSYFKGALVQFKIPSNSEFAVKFKEEIKLIPSNSLITIKLNAFPFGHYGDSYFDPNYTYFAAPMVTGRVHLPANQPTYVGTPYIPESGQEDQLSGFTFMRFYVPHDWISSVCVFGANGLERHKVPDHKYEAGNPECTNVDMTLPSFSGAYADDIRAVASCLAFKANGFARPYPEKAISGKVLGGFIKGNKDNNKTTTIIEMVLKTIAKPCLYKVDNIAQWQSVNRIVPAEKILIFFGSQTQTQQIILTQGENGGSVFIICSEVSKQIQDSDPEAKRFLHDESSFDILMSLTRFDIKCSTHGSILAVIKDELLSSTAYGEYLKSKEYMDEMRKSISESMSEHFRRIL